MPFKYIYTPPFRVNMIDRCGNIVDRVNMGNMIDRERD